MDTTLNDPTSAVVEQEADTHEKSPKQSFGELRKAKDDLERQLWQAQKEKELIEKQFQMQLQAQNAPKTQVQQEPEYDFSQLEREEFPDGKNIAKAFGSLNKKLSGYDQKLYEKDLKIQALEFAIEHADFKDVVTAENIEKYIKSDEDNKEAVEKASNPLRKVYSLIKKSAAYQKDLAAKQPISQEQKRVEEKEAKPVTGSNGVRSAAVTVAAKLSNSKMTKEQRNALWAETLAASRR